MAETGDGTPVHNALVGGIPFRVVTRAEAVAWTIRAAINRERVNVRLANAYNVALASRDEGYKALLSTRGVNFPDGTPVVWAMNHFPRRGGAPRASRVRGPSLFEDTLQVTDPAGVRHFFLGGSPSTLEALREQVAARMPRANVVGTYSPPFAPVNDAFLHDCAERIAATDANLVWVGLGTPKQDVVGTQLAERLGLTTVNVGAAFDFFAGTIREAPRWIQDSGLEWLFRLLSEPRRLWKRYTIGNLQFVVAVVRSRLREGDRRRSAGAQVVE